MNESVIALIVNDINDHLKNSEIISFGPNSIFKNPVRAIQCKDGTIMSVQAGKQYFCKPKNNHGPWTHVEVMILSDTDTTYFTNSPGEPCAFVPIEDVAKEIISRGNRIKDF